MTVKSKSRKVLKKSASILMLVIVVSSLIACGKKDWGIILATENVTPTGLTLKCTQSDGTATGDLQTGNWYRIERLTQGKRWKKVKYLDQEGIICWTLEAINIPNNDSTEWNINWEGLYGDLSPGTYRIAKEVKDFRKTGDYEKQIYYAEFEIDYPWKIGAKSNLKFYNEDNVQLSLGENTLNATGAEFILKADEFIKYGEEFIIETQLEGKWYSIDEEFDWHAIECTMQAGTEQVLEIDWSSRYGKLPAGNYRFIKPIIVSGTEKYLCCEFKL